MVAFVEKAIEGTGRKVPTCTVEVWSLSQLLCHAGSCRCGQQSCVGLRSRFLALGDGREKNDGKGWLDSGDTIVNQENCLVFIGMEYRKCTQKSYIKFPPRFLTVSSRQLAMHTVPKTVLIHLLLQYVHAAGQVICWE